MVQNKSMKLLTVKQVAEIVGAKASTIYQWAELGQIPCIKLNGLLRFSDDEIWLWIESCKKDSNARYNNGIGRRPRKGGKV